MLISQIHILFELSFELMLLLRVLLSFMPYVDEPAYEDKMESRSYILMNYRIRLFEVFYLYFCKICSIN